MAIEQEFLDRIERIVIYRKGKERAPHKPLYLLLCIASLQQGLPRLQAFRAIEPKLKEALLRFGLSTTSVSPQYPFWRLKNDGLAVVEPEGPYEIRKQSADPTKSSLLKLGAEGGLTNGYYDLLAGNLNLQTLAVHRLLEGHFPRSIHDELIDFFGLRMSGAHEDDANTESTFRAEVLSAYNNTCAVSGYSLGFRDRYPGLEAAHICWPQSGGNDEISNGIAMTTLHRKLFHLGLFGIDDDFKVIASPQIRNLSAAGSAMVTSGRLVSLPERNQHRPNLETLRWHRKWVFRG
jgi:putative restriction endonuclease